MSRTYTNLNSFLANYPKQHMTDRDYKFLSHAEQISRLSPRSQHQVGCVISQRNEMVGVGYNTAKTHPFQARWNKRSPYLHAETMALIDAMKNKSFTPDRSTIYVSRYSRHGMLGCSYPCEHCWSALNHVGIRNIVCYDHNNTPTKVSVI